MRVEDRFTRGFIAGLIAGVPAFVFNQAAYYLKFSTLRWTDFLGIFIYGKKPVDFQENLFAAIVVHLFLSFLGIIFAYLILKISSDNHILKGWVFALSIWFASFSITSLSNKSEISLMPMKTAFSNFIGATIWGISLALVIKWLDSRSTH